MRPESPKLILMLAGTLVWALTCWSPVMAQESAFRQKSVDDLVSRIGKTIQGSLETADWRRNYAQAGRSIEDLKKTLQYGGKVRSNPIAEFKGQLDALWKERRDWLTYLEGTVIRLQLLSSSASQQAIRDIGGAMIRFLQKPVPGGGALLDSARTQDADIIRKDFERIRTQEQAIKRMREYIDQLLKNMSDLKARRAALEPLSAAYAALIGLKVTGAEGVYQGTVDWKQSNLNTTIRGNIKLRITDGLASGTIEVLGRSAKRIAEIFEGRVSADGTITAAIKGKSEFTGSTSGFGYLGKVFHNFAFVGSLTGKVAGNRASGSFKAKSSGKGDPIVIGGIWKALPP